LVANAQNGDMASYNALVDRYQDMAVGYGYSLLGDFHRAQDVAQEAFLEAAVALPTLREPLAFASWLRTIVFNQCDRVKRRHHIETVSLEAACEVVSPCLDLQHRIETEERKLEVARAIGELPEHQRVVVLLFYMSEYSQSEIADFLGVAVTTVKKRLHDARRQLKTRMTEMLKDELPQQRPSKDEKFMHRFTEMMSAVDKGDTGTVRDLLQLDPALVNARGPYWPAGDGEMSPLLVAANFNQTDIALLLLEQGANPREVANGQSTLQAAAFHKNRELVTALVECGVKMNIFAAAGLGDTEQLQNILADRPQLVTARDATGATALHHAGNAEVARVLLDAGADIEATEAQYHNTPIEYACIYPDVVELLRSRGAKVRFYLACAIGDIENARRELEKEPGLISLANANRRPEANTLPLSIAIVYGELEMVKFLLDNDAEVNAPSTLRGNATSLHFAARNGDYLIVELLLQRGGNVFAMTSKGETPLDWAREGQRDGWGKWRDAMLPRHEEVIQLLRGHSV
jgi:RNA polymerase sigma factor (sigma-70 family)